jgi:hypothetical protein
VGEAFLRVVAVGVRVTFLAPGLRLSLARTGFLPGAFRADVRVAFFAAGFFLPFVRTDLLLAINLLPG